MPASEIIKVLIDFDTNVKRVVDNSIKQVDSIGDRLGRAGENFAPVSLAAGGILVGAVKLAADLDKNLQAASRALDLDAKGLEKFRENTNKLQEDLKYQFDQTVLAGLQAEAGKLGVAADDVDDFAKVIGKLAVATDQVKGIEKLSSNAAKVSSVFSLSIPELERWGAAVNKLDDSNAATSNQIIDFTKRAGGVAAVGKVSAKALSAYGATLINAGEESSVAATFMNKFLTVLGGANTLSADAKDGLKLMGIQASDLAKRFDDDATGAMKYFLEEVGKLDSITQRDVLGEIFGQDHIDSASKLVGQIENLKKNLKAVEDDAGNLDKIQNEFDKLSSKSFEGQFNAFKNLLITIGQQLGLIILPTLVSMLGAIKPFVSNFLKFVQANPLVGKIITGFLLLLASVSPLLFFFKSLHTIAGLALIFISNAIPLVTGAFTALTGAILPIGGAILGALAPFASFIAAGLVIAGLAYIIIRNWGTIAPFFANLWNGLRSGLSGMIQGLTSSFSQGISNIKNFAGNVKTQFEWLINSARTWGANIINGLITGIRSRVTAAIQSVADLVQQIRNYLPSSPAKTGALSDLDKTGYAFADTFMNGVKGSGLGNFLDKTLTSPKPSLSPTYAKSNSATGNGSLVITYNISGSKNDSGAIMEEIKKGERRLLQIINQADKKYNRRFY